MKTKEFNKVKPYTYLIIRKSDNMKYHGVKLRNKVSPKDDFAKNYFGSSATSAICKEFKKDIKKFKYRLAWTFDSEEEARIYETKVNRKIYKRSDWANSSAFPAIDINEEVRKKISKALNGKRIGKNNTFYGKKHTQESKNKVSKKNRGKKNTGCHILRVIYSNLTRVYGPGTLKKISKINKDKKFPKEFGEKIAKSRIGMKLSEEHKKNIGLGVKGEKNGMFGKTQSFIARQKISKSKIGKIPWNKGKKYKTKNIPWNKGIKWKRKINRKEVNIHA